MTKIIFLFLFHCILYFIVLLYFIVFYYLSYFSIVIATFLLYVIDRVYLYTVEECSILIF